MDEIVTKAGVGFAFPSRTLYLGRDLMPDNEFGAESEEQVEKWRQSGELPFPTARNERIAAIDGTLDYPPRGSGSPDSISVASGKINLNPLIELPPTDEVASSSPDTLASNTSGISFMEFTVIVTVAVLLSKEPSFAV